jgi:hypothetical protein
VRVARDRASLDLVCDPFLDLEVAQHGASALRIKTEEVSLVNHKVGSDAELGKRIGGQMVAVNVARGRRFYIL